jgi:hypothetical protein
VTRLVYLLGSNHLRFGRSELFHRDRLPLPRLRIYGTLDRQEDSIDDPNLDNPP